MPPKASSIYELGRVLNMAAIIFYYGSWLLICSTSPFSCRSLPEAILYLLEYTWRVLYSFTAGGSSCDQDDPLELTKKEFANTKISLSLNIELASEFLQLSLMDIKASTDFTFIIAQQWLRRWTLKKGNDNYQIRSIMRYDQNKKKNLPSNTSV